MAYCTNCGAKLIEGSKFCAECGEKVISVEGAQVTQQQSQSQQPQNQQMYTQSQQPQNQQSYTQSQQLQYQQSYIQYQQPQSNKTKSKAPVIIGIASAIVVIAIICVVAIAGGSDKKDKKNNNVANNTEKPTDITTEATAEKPTEAPATEVATEEPATEAAVDAKTIDAHVPEVVKEILAAPEYISSIASLGVYGDFNDDGVKELLLTYEVNSPDTGYCVIYSLMRIDADGGEIIRQDTLYEEVGGNSGYCGVTEYNGTKYFTLVEKIPNGQGYIEYMNLFPWDVSGEKLINDGSYYLECAVNIDEGRENGIFIWGDQKISMEEYDAKKNEISWIHKLDPAMGPDPGYTASFDEPLTIGSY